MFRCVTDSEFPGMWVVVMDDPERGEIKMSGPFTDIGEGIYTIIPRLEARMAEVAAV